LPSLHRSATTTTTTTAAPCWTNATQSDTLHSALQELGDLHPCHDTYHMVVDYCLRLEYVCFADHNCQECLAAVIAATNGGGSRRKADAFRSPACNATNPAMLKKLLLCAFFPSCTFSELQCSTYSECRSCLTTLRSGDGTGAALQCSGTQPSSLAMNDAVNYCTESNAVACEFWHQRCVDSNDCSDCLADMGNGDNPHTILPTGPLPPVSEHCTGVIPSLPPT
jgi:hypothetical protein